MYVEVQSADGAPLPGYGLADALPVIDDGVALTVEWRGGPSVAKLAGEAVRLRFAMQGCKLYAFQFV